MTSALIQQLNTRLLSGVLFVLIAAVMQGCAYAPQVKQLQQDGWDNLSIAKAVELTDVPFFPQQKYQCGPAALATVLNYNNINVEPEELRAKVYVPKRQGSFQIEMIAATRQYGKLPYQLDPSLEDLLREVGAGNPVLILQNLAFESLPQWHFAVVVGYDLNRSEIILRSATSKRWTTSLSNFEQTWRKSNYWALVVTGADKVPPTASVSKWLAAGLDLEKMKHYQQAQQSYRAATRNWPLQDKPWLALSNLFYKQKRYQDASATLKQALSNIKGSAELWNNYAYLLKQQGCYRSAQQAAACALQLKADDKNIIATWQEMQQLNLSNSKSCALIQCDR